MLVLVDHQEFDEEFFSLNVVIYSLQIGFTTCSLLLNDKVEKTSFVDVEEGYQFCWIACKLSKFLIVLVLSVVYIKWESSSAYISTVIICSVVHDYRGVCEGWCRWGLLSVCNRSGSVCSSNNNIGETVYVYIDHASPTRITCAGFCKASESTTRSPGIRIWR